MDKNKELGIDCESRVGIASDVVGKIAAIAALEVDGVSAMGNNITAEILGKVGMKNLMKNVKVDIIGKDAYLELSVTLMATASIPNITPLIQNRVKQAVENMTGLNVREVNVRISGINL